MLFKPTLLALALASTFASAAPLKPVREVEGITEYRLPNGLQILLAPDGSKPTTTVNVTYRVGSRNENYGETGMAHLLEHLLFKGSPRHPDPKADFTKRGFSWNGSTWFDRTNYFAAFASSDDNLKAYLDWQADAMVNSFVARKDLDSEMTVVRNEMEMGENDPGNVTSQKALGAMYLWHNYGKDTIGARADVENVNIPHLQAFYRNYYQPDNATLIISGKFDTAKTLAWVEAAFSKIPKPKREIQKTYTIDPVQDGENFVTVRRVGGNPMSLVAYHVPAGPTADYAAVDLLNLVLTEAPTGRLYQRLVIDSKLASNVGPFSLALAEPGFAMYTADLAPGASQDALNKELSTVTEGFADKPLTAEELARAKTRWLNRWDKQFTSPEQVGIVLSEFVSQGDWRLFFLMRDRVKAMNLADVQRVATQYLLPSNRTLAQYIPTEKPQRTPLLAQIDLGKELSSFKPAAAAAAVAAFDATPANIDKQTVTKELAGGLKLAMLAKPTRGGAVRGVLNLRVGSVDALKGLNSTAGLTAQMLKMGTASKTREQLRDALDAAKVELTIAAPRADRLQLSWSTTREHAAEAIALIGEMLRTPRMEAAALEELRAQGLAALQQQRDDPQAIAPMAVATALNQYPADDVRYRAGFEEQEAALKAASLDGVKAFQQRFYGIDDAQLALAGDFDAAASQAAAEKALGGWKAAAKPDRVHAQAAAKAGKFSQVATPDKQNAMMFAQLPIAINDENPDRAALLVADQIFGNGGSSRLWTRIREKDGLSYGVGSWLQFSPVDNNSGWLMYAIFAPQNRAKVEADLRDEAARAMKDGFTAKEVADARQALLSERQLQLAQDATLAKELAANLELKRTLASTQKLNDEIAAVTPEAAIAALRKYYKLDAFQLVFAGDFK